MAASPGDVDRQIEALDAAVSADARPEARTMAERLLARRDLNGVLRAHAESALGDLAERQICREQRQEP